MNDNFDRFCFGTQWIEDEKTNAIACSDAMKFVSVEWIIHE